MKSQNLTGVYQTHDVSCSAPQLVILLCDGAIRFTREALDHMQAGRWPEKGKSVESAHECITELRKTLDLTNSDPLVKHLDQHYDLLSTKLLFGNSTKDPVLFQQVIEGLETVRTSWQSLFDRLRAEGHLKSDFASI